MKAMVQKTLEMELQDCHGSLANARSNMMRIVMSNRGEPELRTFLAIHRQIHQLQIEVYDLIFEARKAGQ